MHKIFGLFEPRFLRWRMKTFKSMFFNPNISLIPKESFELRFENLRLQVKRTRDGNRLSLAIFLTNDLISKIKSLRKPTWSSETFFFFSKNLDLTSTISRRFIFADVSQLPFAHATRSNTVGKPYCGNALWKVNAEERSDTWFKWDVERKASFGSN